MKRTEFMRELEQLLMEISEEERRDALDYYNDYLDEAGADQEEQVIRELGGPQKVAMIIKDSLNNHDESNGAYTETGYQDARYESRQEVENRTNKNFRGQSQSNKILKIILVIFILLVGWPIFLAIASVIFSVIIAILSLIFGLGVTGIAVLGSGIALLVVGIMVVVVSPAVAMLLCGSGILLGVAGLLFTMLVIKICQVLIPPLCRGFVVLCRKPFERKAVAS